MANGGLWLKGKALRRSQRLKDASGAATGRAGRRPGEGEDVRFDQLEGALEEFLAEAARYLQREVEAGAEVPLELERRSGPQGPALYCYRPLSGEFVAKRTAALRGLTAHARAVAALEAFPGLERYVGEGLAAPPSGGRRGLAEAALKRLLEETFAEQTEFILRRERLERVLADLKRFSLGGLEGTVAALPLRGIAIAGAELPLADGLVLARPEACRELPEELRYSESENQLIALFHGEGQEPQAEARAAYRDLLRALWLFGDGRLSAGPLAFLRSGGRWRPFAFGSEGDPGGVLVVTPGSEDELRAFCALIKRRRPQPGPIAWALHRYELGCARRSEEEALTDYLLALRALLEEDGKRGALAERVAVLCAPPQERAKARAAVLEAQRLEAALIAGIAGPSAAGRRLVQTVGGYLRSLLRDLLCGHLSPELCELADRLILEEGEGAAAPGQAALPSFEQETSELAQPG